MGHYPSHLTHFHGLPVHLFDGAGPRLPAPASVAWRLSAEWEIPFEERWGSFLDRVRTDEVVALVVGAWWQEWDEHGIGPVLDLLTAEAHRFPGLRAVFLADVVSEETEISWIRQGDVSRVLRAWPGLRELGVRGAEGLVVEPLRHEALRVLRVESGGLPPEPVRALAACDLPALRHLELWLGTAWYGGDCTVDDVRALLAALDRSPGLLHLGLRNSDIQDGIAAAVAAAPVVAGLDSLDLSMGALGDDGGAALLSGQPLTHLRALGLGHHFMSEEMVRRVRGALGPHVPDLDLTPARRRTHRPEARYVAVGE
ncbi:STM4015 family protein [Streptomyces sp. Tu 3180]|uniref:STM4015 family protein n=1 Tax=Streptomyces sp. Tu 3180 TaxID=2682611 RepID=UPI001358699F|nr:STM4015 family protein [Streptomyces sp. Tu 3180]KAF3463657.1 leucine-rich repeat domain-containing protein [Streptomyces sp. Tu 3180]